MVINLDKNNLIQLLQNPESVSEQQANQIQSLIEQYPYFQTAHALLLNHYKNTNNHLFNQQLKTTAAHTTDRNILFEFVTKQKNIAAAKQNYQNSTTHPTKAPSNTPQQGETKLEKTKLEKTESEALNTNQPLRFGKEDKHAFDQWLKLNWVQPLKKEHQSAEKQSNNTQNKFELIDKFIQQNPKLTPSANHNQKNLAEPFTATNQDLMTETLAKVYVQQKNYKKAIQAYKILILKNPEKSGFFADQIRAIKKLQ